MRKSDDQTELFRVIIERTGGEPKHPIRPDDIDPALTGTFGKHEVEQPASRLVLFFQSRGYWCEFTHDELRRFYEGYGWDMSAPFYGLAFAYFEESLADLDWREPLDIFLAQDIDGTYAVTDRFIERCGRARKKAAA